MPSWCKAPMCRTGYKTMKKSGEKKTIFSVPKDPVLLAKWQRAIPRDGIKAGDGICEKHFAPDQVERFFDIPKLPLLPNGDVFNLPRSKARLKPGALPTIFPNCPAYLSSTKKPRKPPKERSQLPPRPPVKKKRKSPEKITEPQSSEIDEIVAQPDLQDYFVLPHSPDSISLQDVMRKAAVLPPGWSVTFVRDSDMIAILHWTGDHIIDKKILIHREDLRIQVYLRDILVRVSGFENLTSDDPSRLVEVVENMRICSNAIPTISVPKCHGFASQRTNNCYYCNLMRYKSRPLCDNENQKKNVTEKKSKVKGESRIKSAETTKTYSNTKKARPVNHSNIASGTPPDVEVITVNL